MKKALAFLAAMAVTVCSFSAFAQNYQQEDENVLFKHLSVGVGLGLSDGIQLQVATTLLPRLQARVLYSDLAPTLRLGNVIASKAAGMSIYPLEYTISGINYHERGFNIDEVALNANAKQRELSVLADFFPSQNSSFHLTAGVIIPLQKSLVSAVGTPKNTKDAQPAVKDNMKGNAEIYGITTDMEGNILLDVQYGAASIRPYLGIGFGRPCSTKHRVGFNMDLGVSFIGGLHAYSYNYINVFEGTSSTPDKVELNRAWVNQLPDEDKEKLGDKVNDILKYTDMVNTFPVAPYLRFTINVALF